MYFFLHRDPNADTKSRLAACKKGYLLKVTQTTVPRTGMDKKNPGRKKQPINRRVENNNRKLEPQNGAGEEKPIENWNHGTMSVRGLPATTTDNQTPVTARPLR